MDILLLLLQLIGIAIWLAILATALILVSKFLFFFSNGKQWRPVWPQGTGNGRSPFWLEVHCVLHGGPFPLHLEQQHLPGTESVYFDLDNTPWVKCDKCHTPFHLQCGTWESLYVVRSRCFLCTFFVAGNFRSDFSCHPFLFRLICLFFLRWVEGLYVPMAIRKRRKRKKRNQVKRIRTRTGPLERKPRPSKTPVWAEGPHTGINLQEISQWTRWSSALMKSNKSKWKQQQTTSHQNYHETRYAGSMDLLLEP